MMSEQHSNDSSRQPAGQPVSNTVSRLEEEGEIGADYLEELLDIADLGDLRKFQRRSPYNNEPPITVYLRKDVEAK